ncbi:MAG TPA: choice-of-anchor D domain-containing protein [Candidatus Kapabacteria bacterium]|nr:choice-of-anchor D domain-containing protein [Candidatus Kapabacteria bacterium]
MNKKFASVFVWALAVFLNSVLASAQSPSPDRTKLAMPGYAGDLNFTTTADPGTGGANHTWDFSGLSFAKVGTFEVVQPDTTPYFSSYSSSNFAVAFTLSGVAQYNYYRVLDTAIEDLGFNIGSTSPEQFIDARTELVFPSSFGDTLTDGWQKVGGSPDHVTVRFDGYGTLITPKASHQVMRIAMDYGQGAVDYNWWTLDPLMLVAAYSHNGNILITFDGSSTTAPHLTVPSTLTFDTLAGTSQTASLTLQNSGTSALPIPSFMLRNGTTFSLADTSVGSIAAEGSATISLTFAPRTSGTFYDTLVIGPADAPLALVDLSGIGEMGRIEITKDTTLLTAIAGASDTAQVAITNHGNVPIMITVARVLNTTPDYSVEGLVDPLAIGESQSANLSVYYSPTATSPTQSSATVSLTYTDGGTNRDTTFVLNGNVVTSGVSEPAIDQVSMTLSPNPASNRILIDGSEGITEIRILDAAGREVLSQKVSGPRAFLDVSQVASGVYTALLLHKGGSPIVQQLTILH